MFEVTLDFNIWLPLQRALIYEHKGRKWLQGVQCLPPLLIISELNSRFCNLEDKNAYTPLEKSVCTRLRIDKCLLVVLNREAC